MWYDQFMSMYAVVAIIVSVYIVLMVIAANIWGNKFLQMVWWKQIIVAFAIWTPPAAATVIAHLLLK